MVVVVVGSGGGSQRLLCLNPTTVMVVLFLGLWLFLGCDNILMFNLVLYDNGLSFYIFSFPH